LEYGAGWLHRELDAVTISMSSEHWEASERDIDCALRRRPEERGEFLNEVCPDNETVRHEVNRSCLR